MMQVSRSIGIIDDWLAENLHNNEVDCGLFDSPVFMKPAS